MLQNKEVSIRKYINNCKTSNYSVFPKQTCMGELYKPFIIMSNVNKKLNNNYEPVNSDLNKKSVSIIKDKNTGVLYFKKTLTTFDLDVYKYLHDTPIKNIPKIIDYNIENDVLTIIEEYIEGITLSDFLEIKNLDEKTFYTHIYKLCDIIQDLQDASSKDCKNEKSIIHRDIKPDNIIITSKNDLYLIDLNAAKFYNENENRDTVLIGTEGFAAPEQYGFGQSNKSTDIYAIGKLIEYYIGYFDDIEFSKRILKVIDKCCKIDYKDRYKNILELKIDLFKVEHNFMNLLLPGFRTLNIIHMSIAIFAYLLLIYVCFFSYYASSTSINILIFVSSLLFILAFFNYLDIDRFIKTSKSKNLFVKYLSKFILALIIPSIIISLYILL